MTASEIAKKVVNKEPFFILDVRNEDAFVDWKIEGENIQYLNIPYFDLLDGVEEIMDQLPRIKTLSLSVQKKAHPLWLRK